MLSIITAKAQDYYDTNDYGFDVEEGTYLTGNQWHTDGYSYLEADNNRFLVIAGSRRFYQTLPRPDIAGFQLHLGDVIVSCRPFFYSQCLGWYIVGKRHRYFLYPDGRCCYLGFRPVYYNYHYNVCGVRYINFYHWHFWSGRHHHRYHGPRYKLPRHYHKPAPVYHRGHPQLPPPRYDSHRGRNYRQETPYHDRRREAPRRPNRGHHRSHERHNHR